MEASKISELDNLLDLPTDRRSKKKSDICIKGKQDTLNDVSHLIANIITFSRFWADCTIDSPDLPAFVNILLELADELSSADYRRYDAKYSQTIKYIPHTLFCHTFNMFSIFAANVKDPNLIRALKGKCTIDRKPYDVLEYMSK